MSYHIRKVKTGSRAVAVHVIKYERRKRVVVKHIGSAHNKDGVITLCDNMVNWISEQTKQIHIFHYKEYPIILHVLICFMALAVSKYIEIKTNQSINVFISECRKITDAKL